MSGGTSDAASGAAAPRSGTTAPDQDAAATGRDAAAPDLGHGTGHDRSGWGRALRPGRRPALLLIDMVRAYFDEGGAFELPSGASLHAASRLLAAAREAQVPVVHTRVRYAPGGADGGVFFAKVAGLAVFAGQGPVRPDEPGAFRPEVAPAPGELVITKQMPSAFFGTSLAGTLTAMGVDTVLVAGVSTSGCVRASATDAMSHGFVPIVVADACGERSEAVHESNLGDLAAKYAEVVSEAEALTYLRRIAAGRGEEPGTGSPGAGSRAAG